MADIFISYSSKDRAQAEQLTELLVSAGLSVWIDRQGIDLATSWSGEITRAIDGCKALVVLLSPSSVESKNVVREVSLAFERNKKLLPLELEPVVLTDDLAYHLAGLQRTAMTNIDSIIRALGKIGLEATQAPTMKLVKETEGRKSLMILPFEDLSPTGDNGWFADGIASELVNALSNVKALKLIDWNTARGFKDKHIPTPTLAREFSVRYFIEGQVRKFGNQIKISVTLLDIESGDHLWQDAHKGTMENIFEIQEEVALKVVQGLEVHLASDEKKKLAERGTELPEAYGLYMKAEEYFDRQTKEGFQFAIQLLTEAIALDNNYAQAYHLKANALTALYGNYEREPVLLDEAEVLCKEALRQKPDLFRIYSPLTRIYLHRGDLVKAEETAREFIRKAPQNPSSYFTLGFFYTNTGQYAKAIAPYEESVRLKPEYIPGLWNLIVNCDSAGEREKCARWAEVALPLYERHLRLHPDDENKRVQYAALLHLSGRTEDALTATAKLIDLRDGNSLYSKACLFAQLGNTAEALKVFRKAIEANYRNIRLLKDFLTDAKEGIGALAGTLEYEEVKRMVEEIEAEVANHG